MTAPTTVRLTARVAGEIRAELARRGMAAYELAELLGVSRSWVSYRLRVEQTIDLDDLERISEALGVSIFRLLGEPEQAK